ncbi:hypothetical protein ACQ4LE_002865 [Meloidogyne hapla]
MDVLDDRCPCGRPDARPGKQLLSICNFVDGKTFSNQALCVYVLRTSGQELMNLPIRDPATLIKRVLNSGGVKFDVPIDQYLNKFALVLKEPVCIRWPFAFIIDFKGARFVDVIGSYLISPCGARTSLIECVQKFTDNRHWIDADLDLLIFAFAFSETIETGFCNELNFSVASLQVVVTPDNDKNCLQTL